MPQITKFTHPKALQLHSKPEDVLDLRASGWEDNKVVITPEFAGSAGLLLLHVFLLFFLADPSIYRICQYEPDDFMTTLRQPKNWKRQESLVTSREEVGDPRECEFLEFGKLHPWMFDLWNLFYGGKFCNAVTYKFVFWNLLVWKPSESFHYCVNVTDEVNWSNMLELWMSVDHRFAEVTRGLADIGCPACDPDIFPLKIWMNRQCMKSCGGNCCRFWAWYHRTS